ncbi:response regulator [Granulosicoccus sp. 3-233]|uniref:response regulator n=1 Tax=Granulosicoccus sp. 3-233 TaxID=3417969 RepID=UPI003D343CD9
MKKVLLIEDDEKLSLALRLRLAHMNFQVHSVSDAIRAMDEAVKSNPDVVLLDINLPGGDGFMVAERLRRHHATMSTPIIFITASERSELENRASQVPRSFFLQKPFDALQLHDTMEACECL